MFQRYCGCRWSEREKETQPVVPARLRDPESNKSGGCQYLTDIDAQRKYPHIAVYDPPTYDMSTIFINTQP